MDLVRFYENLPLPAGQVAGIVVGVALDRISPARLPGSRSVQCAVGALLLVSGGALNVWALSERRRHTTGTFELEQPQSLVTTGPYARSRHPMYVGWWFIHLGVGLLRGSAWVAATVPAAVLVEHPGIVDEERMLDREFGDEFARYRERVPRYGVGWRRSAAGAASAARTTS